MKTLQEQEACPKGSTEAWLEIGDGLAPPALCSAFPHVVSWLDVVSQLPGGPTVWPHGRGLTPPCTMHILTVIKSCQENKKKNKNKNTKS